MDLKLTGKLAIVTGSTGGIGFAIAKSLAAEGCRVIINGRGNDRVAEGMKKIQEAHPQAEMEGLSCDLATPQGAAELIQRFPEVDILVNNLGRYEERQFEATSDADWQAIIEINFMSGVRLSRHYLPARYLRELTGRHCGWMAE
jgi:3-oxoacyl-[acyl-carrier protein] reductase